MSNGFLALEDGTVFQARSVGAPGVAFGEAVARIHPMMKTLARTARASSNVVLMIISEPKQYREEVLQR